jgi:hypothetical protein
MRDFELDAGAGPRRTRTAPTTAEADARAPLAGGAGRPGAHDTASLMHLQRTAGNAGVVQMLAAEEEQSSVLDVVGSGGGSPLDDATRSSMEGRFGADFGDVRVHTDSSASSSAESVGANAYTVGSDIAFRSGHFDTGSATGQRTLAHELAHVVQQRSGPVDGTDAGGGIRLSDPGDTFERAAEDTASQIVSMADPAHAAASPAGATAQLETAQLEEDPAAAPPVQRESVPEEEELAL